MELNAWFNTAAFQKNGPGVVGGIGPGGADGNVGRDSLVGPGFKDIDLGIFRDIKFERGITFQIRAEATNALLNAVLVQVSPTPRRTLDRSNDGKITGAAGTARIIQEVGGRLTQLLDRICS